MLRTTVWTIAYQPWAMRLYCWFLALVLLIAAVVKLRALADFAVVIGMYGLVPNGVVQEVAILVPIVEIITGAGLVWFRRWAVLLALGQLLLFYSGACLWQLAGAGCRLWLLWHGGSGKSRRIRIANSPLA